MANIGDLYTSLLNKIKELTQFKFVHIWNNQISQLEEGQMYAFPFPNCFVEITSSYLPLGLGYSVNDMIITIHIGHEEYDAGGGNFEQNVNVFTYRDLIVKHLNGFQPTGCTNLMRIGEEQDYVHTNIYHYKILFKGAFVDSVGSLDNQIPTEQGEINDVTANVVIDRVNLFDKFDSTFDLTFQFY